jgi:hypothetical protein
MEEKLEGLLIFVFWVAIVGASLALVISVS